MRKSNAVLVLVLPAALAGGLETQAAPPSASIAELRTALENHGEETLSAEQAERWSSQALALADKATSRSSFWNAVSFVGQIYDAAPTRSAHLIRSQALEALAARFADAMRWSSLVIRRFVPRFEALAPEEWAYELEQYDRVLDRLRAESTEPRVRAELLYAKALVRVHINRRWDWLTREARGQAAELLDELVAGYGDLPCPGDDTLSIRERAREHTYELEQLHFRASAPATAGTDLLGKRFDLADHRGKVVVLDFWTSFCQPCLAMVPHVLEFLDTIGDKPVVYLGVNGDSERSQALATAQRFKMSWPNLWDGPEGQDGPAFTAWDVGTLGLPAVFVLDTQGRIRYKLLGLEQVQEELDDAVATLLAERPAQGRR